MRQISEGDDRKPDVIDVRIDRGERRARMKALARQHAREHGANARGRGVGGARRGERGLRTEAPEPGEPPRNSEEENGEGEVKQRPPRKLKQIHRYRPAQGAFCADQCNLRLPRTSVLIYIKPKKKSVTAPDEAGFTRRTTVPSPILPHPLILLPADFSRGVTPVENFAGVFCAVVSSVPRTHRPARSPEKEQREQDKKDQRKYPHPVKPIPGTVHHMIYSFKESMITPFFSSDDRRG